MSYIGDKDEKGRYQAVKGKREKISKHSEANAKKIFPDPLLTGK